MQLPITLFGWHTTWGAFSFPFIFLATDLTVAIRESMRQPIMRGFDEVADWHLLRSQLRSQHHALMSAIDARSAAEAADLVEHHIWSAYEAMPRLH